METELNSSNAVIQAKEAAGIPVTDEDLLLQLLNEEAVTILSKLDAAHPAWEPRDHSKNNHASEIHHPCLKNLVYARLNWMDAQTIDIDGRWRVDEGNKQEWEIKKAFGDAGYELSRSQQRFEDTRHKISGKIDGVVTLSKEIRDRLPAKYRGLSAPTTEVKSINPIFWDQHRTIFDLIHSRYWWLTKYPSQLNIYLHMMDLPAGFLVMTTFGKRPRILPMLKDPELWEYDTTRADKVNEFVDRGEYPEPIPFDPSVCGMCNFSHICQPLQASKFTPFDETQKFVLEEYLWLKDQAKKFKEEHARLIGKTDAPGLYHGQNAIVDNIEITSKSQFRKQYDIPKEVKQLFFKGEKESTTTSIDWVGGMEEPEL